MILPSSHEWDDAGLTGVADFRGFGRIAALGRIIGGRFHDVRMRARGRSDPHIFLPLSHFYIRY